MANTPISNEELRGLMYEELSAQEEKLKAYIDDHIHRLNKPIMQHSVTDLSHTTQHHTDENNREETSLYTSSRDYAVSFSNQTNIRTSNTETCYDTCLENENDAEDDNELILEEGTTFPSLDTLNDEMIEIQLTHDTYSMMMISSPSMITWWCCLFVCLLQLCLFVMIFYEQLTEGETLLSIPATFDPLVKVGEFLAIFVLFTIQDDIIDAIRISSLFLNVNEDRKRHLSSLNMHFLLTYSSLEGEEVDFSENMQAYWKMNSWRILMPNALKFVNGVFALVTSFLIVISSASLIDLFKDFSALTLISNVDNICFKLSEEEVFGTKAAKEAEKVEKVRLRRFRLKEGQFPPQTFIYGIMALALYGLWGYFIHMQLTGQLFDDLYPKCTIPKNKTRLDYVKQVGDGTCDEWANNIGCQFDGGDCVNFNIEYPNCNADDPSLIGDGTCHEQFLTVECGFDGLDCCDRKIKGSDFLGDGKCHYYEEGYNTKECAYDRFDCINENYPKCIFKNTDPSIISNGECDLEYFKEECGWDGGDCCQTGNKYLLGNGYCDTINNKDDCRWDDGDCLVPGYPNCHVSEPKLVNDTVCEDYNPESGYNTFVCGYDGGDCDTIKLDNGVGEMEFHREGHIVDAVVEYDETSISAKRMSDGLEFWAGDNPPMIVDSTTKLTDEPSEYRPLYLNAANEAVSTLIIGDELKLTHTYRASPDTDKISLFEATITYENMSDNETYTNLRYREEINLRHSTAKVCTALVIKSSAIPDALEYSNIFDMDDDGFGTSSYHANDDFSSWNLIGMNDGSPETIDSKSNATNHMYQFLLTNDDGSLKQLGPGETFSFDVLYGNVTEMRDFPEELSSTRAEIASIGYFQPSMQCNSSVYGDQRTFFIAFRGVGAKEPLYPRNIQVSYFKASTEWTILPTSGLAQLSPFKTGAVETIDFSFQEGKPKTFIQSGEEYFVAALFEGYLLFPLDNEATVELCLTSDDGAKLYNYGDVIIDNDGLHKEQTICNELVGTGLMDITIEYFQMTGPASIRLEWKPPGASMMAVVPSTAWIPMANVHVDYYNIDGLEMKALPPSGLANSGIPSFKSEMVETINFPNTYDTFAGSGLKQHVAASMVGYIQFHADGEYDFCLSSDDGSKLFIEDVLVIDNDGPHAIVEICEKVLIINKGSIKKIRVEYFELGGGAELILKWTVPGGEQTFVPRNAWIPEFALQS